MCPRYEGKPKLRLPEQMVQFLDARVEASLGVALFVKNHERCGEVVVADRPAPLSTDGHSQAVNGRPVDEASNGPFCLAVEDRDGRAMKV